MTRSPRGRVSVCMATYNGERFVAEQIGSILPQLAPDDELIVVDDASSDSTVSVLEGLARHDPRIRVTARTDNRGYVRTFEEALSLAGGDLLLLSDQDDVWTPDHVEVLVNALEGAEVAATNLGTLGGPDAIRGPYGQADWHLRAADSHRAWRNVLGVLAGNRPYYGCAMGVRAEALARGLAPFPGFLGESHDLWIALYGNLRRSVCHCPQRTVLRRFHESNQTPNRPRGVRAAIGSRLLLLRCIGELRRRIR
ncbi:MAG: glycosyltransferase [Actinomyces sp.]|uniref:glycosyltransferase n=1 Tax=Actinomyces sp. TaxID=29317 RepID=UPI0026DA7607|nr:glycosyltransferase [Actinomyces sp.]MDO4242251.1 glycosyltransferase [Actinomyces sp.]